MKKLIFTLLLTFHFSCTFAGDELGLLKKDISDYLTEQNKTPNQIIKYSDGNGNVARAVLNPDRAKRFIDEIRKGSDYPEKLKVALEQYKPISQNYMTAFNRSPGQYDTEYLDHFDFLFQLMVANASPIRNVNFDAIKDEGMKAMLQASAKMMQAMPTLFLVTLEKQIKDKKFSEAFTPQAVAKLNHLREIQSQALQTDVSPK
ncbi:MAG: hypothetical protein AB1710_09020 [Pseudomonadota bacterium]